MDGHAVTVSMTSANQTATQSEHGNGIVGLRFPPPGSWVGEHVLMFNFTFNFLTSATLTLQTLESNLILTP